MHWINKCPWLSYNQTHGVWFYRIYVLFGFNEGGHSHVKLGKLVTLSLSNIKKNIVLISEYKSKLFSILPNETTDNSISEQFAFCVRYFDANKCTVVEHLLGFLSWTGKNVTDPILKIKI